MAEGWTSMKQVNQSILGCGVTLSTRFHKLFALLFHPTLERFFVGDRLFGGVFADGFSDLHGWALGWRLRVYKVRITESQWRSIRRASASAVPWRAGRADGGEE